MEVGILDNVGLGEPILRFVGGQVEQEQMNQVCPREFDSAQKLVAFVTHRTNVDVKPGRENKTNKHQYVVLQSIGEC